MNIYDKIVYYYEELNMRNPVKGIWFRTETILNVTIAFATFKLQMQLWLIIMIEDI
jgi:hypothetical protein